MTNTGRISIEKFNGYTLVRNAGAGFKGAHTVTMNFLEANRKHFDLVATGAGYPTLGVKNERLPRFFAYCADNGIEVVGA